MKDSIGRESRIKSISSKLQELFEKARARCMQEHPKIHRRNIRTRWVFRDFVEFQSSQHDNSFPTPNDVSTWPDWYLSRWYPLFPDGKVIAEAFVVHCSEGKVPSKNDVEPLAKNKLYSYVKERLKDAIESTIGHDMYEKAVQVNYCASDPEPPNSYKWVFSKKYPEFPSALSQFDFDDLYKCIEALENGHLRVTQVETAPLDETALVNLERVGKIAKKGVPALIEEAANGMLKIIEDATGRREDVDDLPEVMEATSAIMEHWEWKFTQDYPKFYEAIRGGRKRRNRLVDWPAAPLRQLIHAIDMAHFKLIPMPKERVDCMKRSLKPRRADRKRPSIRRTPRMFSPDTDASDSEDDDWNSDEFRDTPDNAFERSQDNGSGDTIRVQAPLGNSIQHPTKRNLPCLASNQRTKGAASIAPAKGALQDNNAESSVTQQVFGHWLEKLSSVVHDESEAIASSLRQEAQERLRHQQTIKDQREQIARNEKELLGQSLMLHAQEETLRRLSQFIDRASRRLRGNAQQGQTELEIYEQNEDEDFEENLQCLIGKFESRIDHLVLENNRNANVIAALADQQTKLKEQLKDKEANVKKAEQRGRREGEKLSGKNMQCSEEDLVLQFVAQYPVFNKVGKIRELRNIYIHWKDLPHNIFHEMLPPGHDLSEVVLGWIAKLSYRLSSAVVLSSFQEEVKRRTQHQPIHTKSDTKSHILTPDDVFKTLQRCGTTGEGNRHPQPQPDREGVSFQGKAHPTMDDVPERNAIPPGRKTNPQAETTQDRMLFKKQQSQMGQTSNGSGYVQHSASRLHPLTTARSVPSASNSNSQGHQSDESKLSQKRKDAFGSTDSNPIKRAKPNTNEHRSIYSPDNIP